ncbi:carbohydrate-binding protein [Paenibacillaceae bacterium]|nr:carbohydrate-binding protein [Paenibacillaceae bacterium]
MRKETPFFTKMLSALLSFVVLGFLLLPSTAYLNEGGEGGDNNGDFVSYEAEDDNNGDFVSYEAEDDNNELSGHAAVAECSGCSNGHKVGGMYNGSSLQFNDVTTEEAGFYRIKVHYASQDARSFYIKVNDGAGERFNPPPTATWDTVNAFEVIMELQQGSNSIVIYDNNWYSPDIDRIEVSRQPVEDGGNGGGENPVTETGYEFEAEAPGNTLTGNAEVKSCGICSGGANVEGLYEGSSLAFNDVTLPAAGDYKLIIHYISGDPRPIHLAINGGDSDKYDLPATAGWNALGTYDITVRLNEGNNTLMFSDQDWYSPNIDKIVLVPIKMSYEAEAPDNVLTGNASISNCSVCSNGKKVGDLYGDSSLTFNNIHVFEAGEYEITMHYISGDPRPVHVAVNGGQPEKFEPPGTGNWDTLGSFTFRLELAEGSNTLTFSDQNWYSPDIDRIETSRPSGGGPGTGGGEAGDIGSLIDESSYGVITIAKHQHGVRLTHPDYSITYNTNNGLADYHLAGKAAIKGVYSSVKLDNNELESKVYSSHAYDMDAVTVLNDGYGSGIKFSIISTKAGQPSIEQSYYLYDRQPYFLKQDEVSVGTGEIATNYIAPLAVNTAGGIDVGSYTDSRVLIAPFDNDQWSTYQSRTMNTPYNNQLYESSELTAFFDNTSRNGLVIGSVTHDTWKTGIYWSGSNDRVNTLRVYGGYSKVTSTHDTVEHGKVSGSTIASPRILIGYFSDYRDGLETYGSANAVLTPPLPFGEGIPQGVPVGWNSWGAYDSTLNYEQVVDVSNYFKEKLQHNNFNNEGTIYINLDSYWDMLTDEQLRQAVELIHDNGQKAGIYWGPFVFWGDDMNWVADGTNNQYTFGDLVLKDADGNILPTLSGAYALDPTHPGTQMRIQHYINRFKNYGFEFIKLDFLTHGSLEGDHYDPTVHTGIQAYNKGMEYVVEQLDDQMFISASIAPLFPSQYAHSRRISCDVDGSLSLTQYQLNNQTYGWWQNGTIYHYTDPDYMTLKKGGSYNAAQTRVNAVAISGTLYLSSDDVRDEQAREYMEALLTNPRINQLALKGKAFRPVEGNTGTGASDVFVLKENEVYYMGVFNYTNTPADKTVSLERAGIPSGQVRVTDLWTGQSFVASGTIQEELEAAQSKLYLIERVNPAGPGGPSGPGPAVGPDGDKGTEDKTESTQPEGDTGALGKLPLGLAAGAGKTADLTKALVLEKTPKKSSLLGQRDEQGVLASLDASLVRKLLAEAGNDNERYALYVPLSAQEEGLLLTIGKDAVAQLLEHGGEQPQLLLLSGAGNYSLPLLALPEGAEEIRIVIRKEHARPYESRVPAGFKALQAVSFAVTYTDSEGREQAVDSLGRYANRTVALAGGPSTAEQGQPAAVFAARVGSSGQLIPVPTRIIEQPDGSYHAVISHSGHGVYVLLEGGATFADIQGHWGQAPIEALASRMVVHGKSAVAFDPAGAVTRAEIAALLMRLLGADTALDAPSFADVEDGKWYSRDIRMAAALGLVSGYEDASYRPEASVTREELALMLERAMRHTGLTAANGGDAERAAALSDLSEVSSWATDAVRASIAAGIIQGDDKGRIRPAHDVSRAEAAAMLYRMLHALALID